MARYSIGAAGRAHSFRDPIRSFSYGAALGGVDEESSPTSLKAGDHHHLDGPTKSAQRGRHSHRRLSSSSSDGNSEINGNRGLSASTMGTWPRDPSQAHHHHVPSNAFLSIGLQTSIAIALHKLPEGFITFATNHVNPKLGFTVFMALFIHNITEGFAMALPLYLALNSRWKAMVVSSVLGGISQPLGAGVAALWFKAAQRIDMIPGERAYGTMFAVTAGIMTSVALQLFAEGLGLTHSRSMCIAFAFVGMALLGFSFALTA
jgi:ZIP family zinc transporter